uniref:G_PROTEIN_RECEP_F1_2 domain-containing protein n=1 Tax=Elaeophora elaphi TaxID=1147741 RepID=A0A0R3S706_9BILA
MKKGNCCLRFCYEKAASSSMDESGTGGAALGVPDEEVSAASTNYTRYYCAQNRLRRSPAASLDHQENNSLLPEIISPTGNQITRKHKSSTYTVLIELKQNENGQSRIRLSSCDSNIFEPSRIVSEKAEDTRMNTVLQQTSNGAAITNKLLNEQRKSEKERRKNERKQESKAAKTLSAILLAFIITWTPYNGKQLFF